LIDTDPALIIQAMQKLQGSETQLKEQVLKLHLLMFIDVFNMLLMPWQFVCYLLELESVFPKTSLLLNAFQLRVTQTDSCLWMCSW
jgi:hypothetical protein